MSRWQVQRLKSNTALAHKTTGETQTKTLRLGERFPQHQTLLTSLRLWPATETRSRRQCASERPGAQRKVPFVFFSLCLFLRWEVGRGQPSCSLCDWPQQQQRRRHTLTPFSSRLTSPWLQAAARGLGPTLTACVFGIKQVGLALMQPSPLSPSLSMLNLSSGRKHFYSRKILMIYPLCEAKQKFAEAPPTSVAPPPP